MSLKITAYFAASLDGYIAKADGSIDWLNSASAAAPAGEDCGFKAFMSSVDTLVMGRKTFEQVLAFGQWPYGVTPVVVLSRKPLEIPATLPDSVSHSSESIVELCGRLEGEAVEHIYVDGGATIQGFLAAGLLNEIVVTMIPVVLGGGITPFGQLESEVQLTLLGAQEFDFGFVQMRYAVGTMYNKRLHPTIASVTLRAGAQAAPATLEGEANVRRFAPQGDTEEGAGERICSCSGSGGGVLGAGGRVPGLTRCTPFA